MKTRREGIQILMATLLGDNMDIDTSRQPFPPDTLGISLSLGTKRLVVRGDGRVATIKVKDLMNMLGAVKE